MVKIGYLRFMKPLVDELFNTVSGIVLINATPAKVTKNGELIFVVRGGTSGICGCALKNYGLNAVRKLIKLIENIDYDFKTVVGVGGILDTKTAIKYLNLGVDAIEIGTGAMYDPCLPLKIKKRLLEGKIKKSC